jgi:hypothetical protein
VAEITEEGTSVIPINLEATFTFSLGSCPRINIEVCSDTTHESDRYRLLLQAGLLVRAMNTIKTQDNSFVSVAIYINKGLSAEWYLVYQPDRDSQEVGITNSLIADHWSSFLCRSEYTKKAFDLTSSLDTLEFFRWLYNFPSAIPDDDNITSVSGNLARLQLHVDAKSYNGFTTQETNRRKTETTAPPGDDHTYHLDNPSTSQMLSKAGYRLLLENQMEGWTPLNPVRSSSIQVYTAH